MKLNKVTRYDSIQQKRKFSFSTTETIFEALYI